MITKLALYGLLFLTPLLGAFAQTIALSAAEVVVRQQYPDIVHISTSDLALEIASDAALIIIDTRKRAEYEVSHLPGAVWVDPDATVFPELDSLSTGTRIVAYCSVGFRSSEIARRLEAAGFSEVVNLEGSIFRWANEGRALVNNEGEATGVHPFNKEWGRLLRKELRDYGGSADETPNFD